MSVSKAIKLQWFHLGAAAFVRAFPGALEKQFGPDVEPLYVCPICDHAFPENAVADGWLTAEHVPPKSLGGRELVLTCKPCNNTAGAKLDSQAHIKQSITDVLTGQKASRPIDVRIGREGLVVNARMQREAEKVVLTVGNNNNPKILKEFQGLGPPRKGDKIDFSGGEFNELGARVSWLRSGFLAFFAVLGYQYTFDPALVIVKRQIRDHGTRLIPSFTIDLPPPASTSEFALLQVPTPHCLGARLGRHVVLFPHRRDLALYDRIDADMKAMPPGLKPATVNATPYEWPTKPTFGLRPEDQPPKQRENPA